MTHTQEETDAELREKLKQLRFDHTDSTPDGYNSLCDDDIDEIMAAVQAHNARIREIAKIQGKYTALARLQDLAQKNNFDKLIIAGYLKSGLLVLGSQLSPIQPKEQDKP